MTDEQMSEEAFLEWLSASLGLECAELHMSQRLADDLEVDSLEVLTILVEVEIASGAVEVPEEPPAVTDIESLYRYYVALVHSRQG